MTAAVDTTREVVVRQLCTGCAVSRDLRMPLADALLLRNDPPADREKHTDCFPIGGATRSEWYTVSARWAP